MLSSFTSRLASKKIGARCFATHGMESLYEYGDFKHPTYLPRPGAGKHKVVGLLPGAGIGQMLIESVTSVFQHCDVKIHFETFNDIKSTDKVQMSALSKWDAILRGPFDENVGSKEDMFFAQSLDLYAYVVHAFTVPGIKTRHKDIDIVIIRENSEGEYSTIEHEVLDGIVESIKVTTKEKSLRIAEYAFEYANLSNRNKITVVHKANIIKKGDGDFLNAVREVADRYPRIKLEEMIVDAACMNLISHPDSFEIILLPNLYGSIIGNVAAGLVGGAGIAPGANIGHELGMFEQGARCSGKNLLNSRDPNPTAFMLAGWMMLRYLNLPYFADAIQEGVFRSIKKGIVTTPDLGGTATTQQFTQEIIRNIK